MCAPVHGDGLDLEQFTRVVQAADSVQRWVQSLPLSDVIADALFRPHPHRTTTTTTTAAAAAVGDDVEDALRAMSELTVDQVAEFVGADCVRRKRQI